MSNESLEWPVNEVIAEPVVTPGAIHVLDNGVLRDATPEEVAEIQSRQTVPSLPPPESESIPMLNLHLVLIEDGHLLTVEGMINSMEGDEGLRAKALWSKALTARRDNWLVNAMWPQLYGNEGAFNAAWDRAAALDPDVVAARLRG